MQCKPCTHLFSSLFLFVKKEYCMKTKEKKLICTLLSHINKNDWCLNTVIKNRCKTMLVYEKLFFIEQPVTIIWMDSPRAERLKTNSAGKWSQDGGTLPTEENFGTLESFLVTLLSSISVNCKTWQNPATGENWVLQFVETSAAHTDPSSMFMTVLVMLHIYTSISHYNTQSDSLWPTLSTQYSLFKSLCRHRQRLVALESGLLVQVLAQRKHVPNLCSRLCIS